MVDIKRESRAYARLHPYDFFRRKQPKGKFKIRHAVTITEQPADNLSLIFGDFVHNLRSALDHVIVASVPKTDRSNATSFPLYVTDPWAKRADGKFVAEESQARENFDRALRGIDDRARAIVIENQPYRHQRKRVPWLLGLISQFDNADKHRQLLIAGGGVRRMRAELSIAGVYQTTILQPLAPREYAKDGTIVGISLPAVFDHSLAPRAAEMDVKYRAVAVIMIRITEDGSGKPLEFALYLTMRDCLRETRRMLSLLEPFAVYR